MSDYFDRVERQLVQKVEAGLAHRSRFSVRFEHLALGVSVLVVVAVLGVFVGIRGSGSTGSPVGQRGTTVVFRAAAVNQGSLLGPSIQSSINTLRQRLDPVFHGVKVSRSGDNVVVFVQGAAADNRARIVALSVPAPLEFYDWEANALTQNGKTVASQLQKQDPAAIEISQGNGSIAAGEPGAGSMPLYDAVKLAAKQPPEVSSDNARSGNEYYLFGAPGSAACATAAKDQGEVPTSGVHCLLSGPVSNRHALIESLPAGVNATQDQQLVVPSGTAVVQAADLSAANPTSLSSPTAQFYILRDHVSLFGNDITHPQQSTDFSGSPDVTFSFTSTGQKAFQSVTSAIAHRGALVSGLGQALNQHFAVALDNKLITVPSIDFKTYPDGIPGNNGADITGNFTIQSARNLATLLRYGPLSVNLTPR